MSHGTHIIGIDPGIVHTGVVSLLFLPNMREVRVEADVILGLDGPACRRWVESRVPLRQASIYVEKFRSRSNLGHDAEMIRGVETIRSCVHGKVLDNTGIKKVVKRPVLEALGIWKFTIVTHHDDLRSAARIAVLGMLKEHNELLADVVCDHLDGKPWRVHS